MNNLRHLFLSLVAAMSLSVLACSEDGDGDGDGDGGGGDGGAVTDACYAQCDAQEQGGCGIGQQDCEDACDAIIGAIDDDCRAKAQAAFECNVANDESCDVNTVCETEAMEYADCLLGDG